MTRMEEVRARAIRLLAESDDPKLVSKLIDIFLDDAESRSAHGSRKPARRIYTAGRV